ncbi:MAG TPA: hypothetical protein VM934_16200 [Pyrinomonadaceae bacterium]|jgi:hypothetical protein|nr:hypothetical protein [Pyrinomonadaceae bacterium]
MNKSVAGAKFATLLLVGLLTLSVNLKTSAARREFVTPPYKITAIKAMLFYEAKGTFSRDVLAKPDFTFWNTIIGEGDAESPSNSTLVLVEVTGKPSPDELPLRKVELTATESRKVLLKRATDIGSFGDAGKFYAGFWLYDTGCQPIKISARITGQTQPSSMTKTIPFACGE